MADPLTTTIRLTQPTAGGDTGTWPTLLNSDMTYIDEAINQSVTINLPDANVTLTADGSSSDQARYLRYNVTGALTADRTIFLPKNVKVGWASNNTTGGHNVVVGTGSGTFIEVPGTGWTPFYCDGTNVTLISFGGTATNDSAPAGSVGEVISSTVLPGSAISLTTTIAQNVTSISLTPGDWDISGAVRLSVSVQLAYGVAFINSVSSTWGTLDVATPSAEVSGPVGTLTLAVPAGRVSLSATTTMYLGAQASFTSGTCTAAGYILARRAR